MTEVFLVTYFDADIQEAIYKKWDVAAQVMFGGHVYSTLEKAMAGAEADSRYEWDEARKEYEAECKSEDPDWADFEPLEWNLPQYEDARKHVTRHKRVGEELVMVESWMALDENAGRETWILIQKLPLDPE